MKTKHDRGLLTKGDMASGGVDVELLAVSHAYKSFRSASSESYYSNQKPIAMRMLRILAERFDLRIEFLPRSS